MVSTNSYHSLTNFDFVRYVFYIIIIKKTGSPIEVLIFYFLFSIVTNLTQPSFCR